MSNREEFSKRTKFEAWQRANGHCEKCTARLSTANAEYHHAKEATFGGPATAENCMVLCKTCHRAITSTQAAVIAKSNRVRSRHLGIKRESSRPLPGGRGSRWRKKLNGQVVAR